MATYQQYLTRFSFGGNDPAFTVNDGGGADNITITPGYYWLKGYSGEVASQLMEHLSTLMAAEIAGSTATYSYSTGLVTLDFNSTTTAVTWWDTDLRDALGFTANLSGAASYVATYKARYAWRPSLPMSYIGTSLDSFWAIEPRTKVMRSNDGKVSSVAMDPLYSQTVRYIGLPSAEILTDECDLQDSFEQFYADAIGQPIRIYTDKTLDTEASIKTGVIAAAEEGNAAKIVDTMDRHVDSYQGMWNVELPLWKVTEIS